MQRLLPVLLASSSAASSGGAAGEEGAAAWQAPDAHLADQLQVRLWLVCGDVGMQGRVGK